MSLSTYAEFYSFFQATYLFEYIKFLKKLLFWKQFYWIYVEVISRTEIIYTSPKQLSMDLKTFHLNVLVLLHEKSDLRYILTRIKLIMNYVVCSHLLRWKNIYDASVWTNLRSSSFLWRYLFCFLCALVEMLFEKETQKQRQSYYVQGAMNYSAIS